MVDYPVLLFGATLAFLTIATWTGDLLRKRLGATDEAKRAQRGHILGAILTLLFLVVGFTFSMALNRYDLRKNCEQTETLAIGTAYSRADLLAPADGSKMQTLLKKYLDQRVRYLSTRSKSRGVEIHIETDRLQQELWITLQAAIPAVPPPLMGLLVTALNDVVNSERSTEAAWRNRIPLAAWILIIGIGIGCAGLISYGARSPDWLAFLIVPVAVSICIFLMADLDSPLGGVIRVTPVNLSSLSELLAR